MRDEHYIRITKIEDDDIEWERLDCPTDYNDRLWQECDKCIGLIPSFDVVAGDPVERVLTDEQTSDAEDDELDLHGEVHGLREGRLALVQLRLCVADLDEVQDGIRERLYEKYHDDDQGGYVDVQAGSVFLVDPDWDGDWWSVGIIEKSEYDKEQQQ